MKKCLIYSLLLFTFITACSKKDSQETTESSAQKSATQALTALLPEDTNGYVAFSSLETVYTNLSITASSVLGFPVDMSGISRVIGLNLSNPETLNAAGIDTQKPVAIAMTDLAIDDAAQIPQFTGLLLIPATDTKKIVATITAAFEKDGLEFTVTQDGELTVFARTDDAQTPVYLAVKDDYVLLGGNPAQDVRAEFLAILSGESELAQSPQYKDVTAKINASDDVFVYVNISALTQQNSAALTRLLQTNFGHSGIFPMGAGMSYVKGFQAFGASANLTSADFAIHTLLTLTENAPSKKLWENIRMNKTATLGIAESPLLFASWAINLAEYNQQASEIADSNKGSPRANPLEGPLGTFEAMSGIDIAEDVINNLGGNVNLGVYDGSTISMANYNTVLSLTVNDEAAMQQVLDNAIKTLPTPQQAMITTQTVDGVKAYVALAGLTQIFLGIHDQQFILATSRPMFQKALAGKIENGFTSSLKPKELAETLKNTGNLLYVNVDEVVRAVRNFEIFLQGLVGGPKAMQDIYTTAGKFEYLLASSQLDGNAVAADLQITTRFTDPFLIEMVKIVQNYRKP